MAGTIMVPGTQTGWNNEVWPRTVEPATYDKMKWVKSIDETERPYSLSNIRKAARVSGAVLAQTSDGSGLTYVNIIGTTVTLTPVGNVVPIGWSENEDAQIDINLDAEARSNAEQALAESTELTGLQNVASLSEPPLSGAVVDGPMIRKAFGRLMGNTNGLATPGGPTQVYAIFSNTAYPGLGEIPEFNNAEIRGDSENPYVKGIWMRGGGLELLMTTVVYQDGSGWHNCMYLPAAFAVGWNVRTKIVTQVDELQHRVILYNNVGFAIKNSKKAMQMITTTDATG